MFSNFIYFIIVLLIYNTYPPSSEKNLPLSTTLLLFWGITFIFFLYTRSRFRKLERRLPYDNPVIVDQRFTTLQTRHSIFAIGLFAFHIYGLSLPAFFVDMPIFRVSPTLLALMFISVFVLYLCIIWERSHRLYHELYRSSISKRSYILSNISFSIPVLLPWTLLAGVADLLNALPLEWPKTFLSTSFGQASYFFFFLLVVAIFGPVMIQLFWRCKPVEQGHHRHRIEALCRKAGLNYANILYWPIFGGRMITAGVMGLVGRFRYILVTRGLLLMLSPEEIDAVIAHEIGHIKRHHLLFYLLFFIGYPFLYYALYNPVDLLISLIITPYGFFDRFGLNAATVSISIFNLVMIMIFLIYFRYIFGYFMRNFERQADAYIYTLLNNAQPLISTFQKIATASSQPADKPNWHHFSIKERIDYLTGCETDRSKINSHNRKIRNSIFIYLAVLTVIGIAGYQLNLSQNGRKFTEYISERAILNEIKKNPDNIELFNIIGMLYHNQKKYQKAINAYEKSLQLLPNQDQVLNNLSWLYATSEVPAHRNPEKALRLAKKAVNLNASPETLDTLAESYFINGKIDKAIEVELQALAKADNPKYYEAQLQRFRQALK